MRLSREYRREAHAMTKPYAGVLALIYLIYSAIVSASNVSFSGGEILDILTVSTGFAVLFVGGQFALSWRYINEKIYINKNKKKN